MNKVNRFQRWRFRASRPVVAAGELIYWLGEAISGQRETVALGIEQGPSRAGVLYESLDGSVFMLPPVDGEVFDPLPSGAVVPRCKLKVAQYPQVVIARLTPDDSAALATALMAWASQQNAERELAPLRATRRARWRGRAGR